MVRLDLSAAIGTIDMRDLAARLTGRRLAVLAGAGISRDSGLPIANELTDEIQRQLRVPRATRAVLGSAKLPFELFIESLAGCSDVTPLYEIYQGGSPCAFHSLCAHLRQRGLLTAIVTTNFDDLFETALGAAGLAYERLWQEPDFLGWTSSIGALPLVKIHGSAHDPHSLGITIRRVANQRGVQAREVAIREVLLASPSEAVLVVGYSGSDRFDINPILGRLAGTAPTVVLVEHTGGTGSTALVEPLLGHPDAGPFAALDGIRVACNTSGLTGELLTATGIAAGPPALSPHPDWHSLVRRWCIQALASQGEAFRPYAIGALLRAGARPRHSRPWFAKALRMPACPWLEIEAQLSLSRSERDAGDRPDVARSAAVIALRLARRARQPKLESGALVELGVLSADLRRYEHAIRYYKMAEKLARASGDMEKLGVCLGNASIARKHLGGTRRWARALRDYDTALDIARVAGDKRSEGRTIGNIGILHSVMGSPSIAILHFKQAAEIARELGDIYHEAIWLVGEADDCFATDSTQAIDLVRRARRMFAALSSARVRECDEHLVRFGVALPLSTRV